MEPGKNAMEMVEGPVVRSADPFEPESPTADLARPGGPLPTRPGPPDPLVPPGPGLRGWLSSAGFVLRRCGLPLIPVGVLAALPTHFFVGRVDDTVVAAPALSDLLGGFALLLLPLMWLAFFAVSALPQVILLAGVTGVALPVAARGERPRATTSWRLVAYRLRPLWAWFAVFGVATQAMQLLLTADRLGEAVAVPLTIVLELASTAVFTFAGLLGGVLLVERGHGPRRAAHLLGRVPAGPLIVASLLMVVLPQLGETVGGGVGSTLAAVVAVLLWAVAALVTYAQARGTEGAVTSASLLRELATPDSY